jgi:hypothetical protein
VTAADLAQQLTVTQGQLYKVTQDYASLEAEYHALQDRLVALCGQAQLDLFLSARPR